MPARGKHTPDHARAALLVDRRQQWVSRLMSRGMAALPFWRRYHPAVDWDRYPDARYLKAAVLALPVHQQLNEAQIDWLADIILDAGGLRDGR